MCIEPDWILFERVHTECTFIWSGSNLSQSQSTSRGGFDPDWSGSRNRALRVRTKKGCGMHVCVDYRQWACFSGLHTVFHVSAQLKKQYDGWLKYRSDEGAMVAVWRCGHLKSTCTCEFVPHNAVWGCDQRTLDSHWIRIRQFGYWIRITVTWSFTAGMMQCLAPS